MKIISSLLIALFFQFCQAKDTEQNNQSKKDSIQLLLFSHYRETGNCVRVETIDGLETSFCSRFPRGLCSSRLEIFTTGDKTKRLREFSKFLEQYPICKTPIALSELINENPTSTEQEASLETTKKWEEIESCEEKGFIELESLFSRQDLSFLNSNKGRLGIFLDKYRRQTGNRFLPATLIQESEDCFQMLFTPEEKEKLEWNTLGKKIEWIKKQEKK